MVPFEVQTEIKIFPLTTNRDSVHEHRKPNILARNFLKKKSTSVKTMNLEITTPALV